MSYETKYPDWKERVLNASEKTQSASAAAAYLGIKYDTYKRYAKQYGCFKTNQSGKGMKTNNPLNKYPLEDILEGKHPQYQSNKLRIRLIQEKVFEHKCNRCGNAEWLGVPIPLELEHKDGQSNNHKLDNLELLCPNCHAFTSSYRGKNTRKCRDLMADTV